MTLRHGITLTPAFQQYTVGNITGFRIRVVASAAVEMDEAIFVYRQIPLQPGATERTAVFDHVGSPADLVDYPVGTPNITADPPWFRANVIDLLMRSRQEVADLWADIRGDVINLVDTLNLIDELVVATPVVIGEPGTDSSSSSGSA